MSGNHVDLRSDTVSRPTPAMRQAMIEAEVGDEQRGEDPTVNALQARVAALLGKEAAVFLPSGTMCNEIALLVHCRPGDEVICDRTAHIITAEGGGPAALAGAMVRALDGEAGVFSPAQLADAVRARNRYAPRSRLVVVEQTSNQGGGTIWPHRDHRGGGRGGEGARAAAPHGRRTADERRSSNPVSTPPAMRPRSIPSGSISARGWAARSAPRWPAPPPSSRPRGSGSSASAAPCGNPASSPPPGCMRWTTMSPASPRTMPTPGASPIRSARYRRSPSIRRAWTAIWSSSTAPAAGSAPPALSDALRARGVLIGAMGGHRLRAVTHLDVDAAAVDSAGEALRAVVGG